MWITSGSLFSLYARLSKCHFSTSSIEYLGHYVLAAGVATDSKKILTVQKWPIPTTLKQIRGFLGLVGYYKRFIQGYISKDGTFKWNEGATRAFQHLKDALISASVLAVLNFNLSCDVGIGAAIMQQGKPIAYLSKGLSLHHKVMKDKENKVVDALSRLPTIELAALTLAVVSMVKVLKGYGRKGISRGCMVKVDMKKAYDSLEWTFLEHILAELKIPAKVVKWIMQCVTTNTYSIQINGHSTTI
ncbi:hypothetical protein KY284_016697 [Solanum tuberosum]|nr:hypothetical protein KY284_016697 [Solanum tuberosum]